MPSLTNELLLTGTRDFQRRGSGDFHTNYAKTLLGLPNPFNAPNWPNIYGTDLTGYAFGSDGLFYLITNVGTLQDNATKIKGSTSFSSVFSSSWKTFRRTSALSRATTTYGTQATALYDPSRPLPIRSLCPLPASEWPICIWAS